MRLLSRSFAVLVVLVQVASGAAGVAATEPAEPRIALRSALLPAQDEAYPETAKAPEIAVSRTVIRGWIERHKGLGAPQYAEAELPDMRVFVAWNIPTSGFNLTYYWVYCLATPGWQLVASSSFVPKTDQIRKAEIDGATREVRFIGARGEVDQRVSLHSCLWRRP